MFGGILSASEKRVSRTFDFEVAHRLTLQEIGLLLIYRRQVGRGSQACRRSNTNASRKNQRRQFDPGRTEDIALAQIGARRYSWA